MQASPIVGAAGASSSSLERDAGPPKPGFEAALGRELGRSSMVVQAQRTALSGDDAKAALEQAWTARFGSPPSRETAALLVAQWAHETGRGASMYNFNFGGIKGSGPSGLSVAQRTREHSGSAERVIVDRFRAYRSAEEGAADYVALLARRFPEATSAAERGDAAGFVRGLKAKGYFTGDEGAYVRSVDALSRTALASGFSELGASATRVPTRLDLPASGGRHIDGPTSLGRLDELSLDDWLASDTPFVSALAMADELGRTAVKILAQEPTDERRSGRAWLGEP